MGWQGRMGGGWAVLLLSILLVAVQAQESGGVNGASPDETQGFLSVTPRILEPRKLGTSNLPTKILLYLPGMGVPAKEYDRTMRGIQDHMSKVAKLFVVIVPFPQIWGTIVPPFGMAHGRVQEALKQMLSKYGMKELDPKSIYIGGHSLGGYFAQEIAVKRSSDYAGGLLLHGAFMANQKWFTTPTTELPIPIIMVCGTRDGQNRISYCAEQYEVWSAKKTALGITDSSSDKRNIMGVFALVGVTHIHFCNNFMNDHILIRDLKSSLSLTVGEQMIVEASALLFTMADSRSTVFEMNEEGAEAAFGPFLSAKAMDKSGDTCVQAQKLHLEESAEQWKVASRDPSYTNLFAYAYSKPQIFTETNSVEVDTYVRFEKRMISVGPLSALTLRCKMKSKAAVTGKDPTNYGSCGRINQEIFDKVYATLPKHYRTDYENSGKNLTFIEDKEVGSGPSWLRGDAQWTEEADRVVVQDTIMKSGTDVIPRYAGMFYCNFASASRIFEYLTIDSGRRPYVFVENNKKEKGQTAPEASSDENESEDEL